MVQIITWIIYGVWLVIALFVAAFSSEWGDCMSKRSPVHYGMDNRSQRRWRKATFIALLVSLVPMLINLFITRDFVLMIELYAGEVAMCMIIYRACKRLPAKKKPPFVSLTKM